MDESPLAEQHLRPPALEDAPAPRTTSTQAGSYSILALIEPFFANKTLIICSVLASMLLGWFALMVWPRKYESEARLLIRVGRESVSLDPTATTSQTMMLQKTQEEEVNSALELMSSRTVFEKVVDKLGTDPILSGYLPNSDGDPSAFEKFTDQVKTLLSDSVFELLVAAGLKDELSDPELAVMELQKSVGIYARKKSTVVIVNSASRSPEMAQAMSQAMVETYLQEHLRTGRTEGSQQFFETQAAAAENQLTELLDKRTEMLQERDIASIESTRQALLTTLTDLETTVRGRLNSLELQEVELASRVAGKHHELQRLRRELAETRYAVHAMQNQPPQKENAKILRTSLLVDRAPSDSKSDSTAQRLLAQKRGIQKELGSLMDFQLQLDDVERSIGVARGRLDKLRSKQEEARLIDELQSKRISNITVVQPATFVERAVSPNKKLFAAGFTGLGLMLGLGLIITREMSSKGIRSKHQLQNLREAMLVVDLPSRPRTFKRFHSKKGGPWKKPVMQNQLDPLLHEVVSMRPCSSEGTVVGVLGLSRTVGTTSVAAALAVHAAAEGLDTLLMTDKLPTSKSSDAESNGQESSQPTNNDLSHSMNEQICYPNAGPLKQLNVNHQLSLAPSEYRGELNRWLRAENTLTIVDIPRYTTRSTVVDFEMLDCVIVVAQADKSTSVDLSRCLRRLVKRDIPIAALVLNKTHRAIPRWIERLVS